MVGHDVLLKATSEVGHGIKKVGNHWFRYYF